MSELFDPINNSWLVNKFNYYNQIRNMDNLYFSTKYNCYVVTKYDDVVFALGNPDIFISSKGNLVREFPKRLNNGTLGSSDNPRHDELKNIVKNAYSKDNIPRINARTRGQAALLLPTSNTFNASDYAMQLACAITAEIINAPYDFSKVRDSIFHSQKHSSVSVDPTFYSIDNSGYITLLDELINCIRNDIQPPGPGVYEEVYKNCRHDIELAKRFFTVAFFAGTSSMVGALQYLIYDLGHEPIALDIIYKDRNLLQDAVTESLRINTATGRFKRTVAKKIILHNTILNPGDVVICCLDSANRDPAKFTNPDIYDIFRNQAGNVGFGYGLHSCIALSVSKSAMIVFLNSLLDNIGRFKTVTQRKDLEYLMSYPGNIDIISNIMVQKEMG